ncbi:unnamed protein product [Fusarium graminearum]|uniref:Chromosome 1, complete genome n=1 Tax=Gibberella zeae (strain ATCC MYA-4620 / CBS 123657 / FGSC 9075 / NRRL 31084 / PH-1) TaxID=229533 RepID=A0A098DBF2_GIBZE|nr:unnamed protein product [Fusarium graminearum]CZS79066.1 unnamed protein product [Fusarium graminearum]
MNADQAVTKTDKDSIFPSHPMLQSPERPRVIGGIRRQNTASRLCPLVSNPLKGCLMSVAAPAGVSDWR